jgi:NAD(P)-dependent dehydrogenase (short-subunit alcohol dehydrogenase family)
MEEIMSFDIDRVPSQEGRIAVITGANAGLGFETARYFAGTGMKVVMACRSEARARDAMAKISSEREGADLEFMQLDLSDLASVRHFADAFRQQRDSLDLLINNAGIMGTPYAKSVDGFESQMAANYFGHYLLTSLLLDLLPDNPRSRVVSLSSLAHTQRPRRIRFEDIHWDRGYRKFPAYVQTKLACLMFALELQRRLEQAGRKTLSVAAHPGVSETELVRTLKPWQVSLMRYTLGPFLSHPAREAALPQVMAALDPGVSGGDYFGPQGFRELTGPPGRAKIMPWARDPEANSRLWELSKKLTGAEWSI